MLPRPVEVLLALRVVIGERTDHDQLNVADLFLGQAVGVDHPERVLPRIEARDLQQHRPLEVDPEGPHHLVSLGDRHLAVLHGERVDRRRLNEDAPHAKTRPDELGHGPDRRVVLVDVRTQERPHRLVCGREVNMAAPDPPGAAGAGEVSERHRLRVVREHHVRLA